MKCPNCKAEIHQLKAYREQRAIAEVINGQIEYDEWDATDAEIQFECPLCDVQIFDSDYDAEISLKGISHVI